MVNLIKQLQLILTTIITSMKNMSSDMQPFKTIYVDMEFKNCMDYSAQLKNVIQKMIWEY